jgi:hypothetical protein
MRATPQSLPKVSLVNAYYAYIGLIGFSHYPASLSGSFQPLEFR